jgi:hypothetical protein
MQYVNIFAEQVLEGLGFALEYTKAYAILEVWSLLAATGDTFQFSLRKTEYICCS